MKKKAMTMKQTRQAKQKPHQLNLIHHSSMGNQPKYIENQQSVEIVILNNFYFPQILPQI